jgi:hypothetical protein
MTMTTICVLYIPWQCTRVMAHDHGMSFECGLDDYSMSTCVLDHDYTMTTLYLDVLLSCDCSMSTCVLDHDYTMTTLYLDVLLSCDYGMSICLLVRVYVLLLLVVFMSSIGANPILTVFLTFCWPMTISTYVVILGLFYTCVLTHEDVCQYAGLKSTVPLYVASDVPLTMSIIYLCSGPWPQYVYLCDHVHFYLCAGLWLCLHLCWPMSMSTCEHAYD